MWPGSPLHVVVGTLKISLDWLQKIISLLVYHRFGWKKSLHSELKCSCTQGVQLNKHWKAFTNLIHANVTVSIMLEKFPDKAHQLFVYLHQIYHAAWNFQVSAFVAYDCLYWFQALARHSLEWAQESTNEVFVGHAKAITRCHHCLSSYLSPSVAFSLPFHILWFYLCEAQCILTLD